LNSTVLTFPAQSRAAFSSVSAASGESTTGRPDA
jgi:hypothetical protein